MPALIEGRGQHWIGGTLRTPNGDLKPTGNKLELDVVEAWDVRDGKLSRLRTYFDGLTMMRTFGAIK